MGVNSPTARGVETTWRIGESGGARESLLNVGGGHVVVSNPVSVHASSAFKYKLKRK